MGNIENKIIDLLNAIYKLPEDEKQKIGWYVVQVPEVEKKKILVAVYKRYEEFKKNANNYTKELEKIGNTLEEAIEKGSAEDVLANI